MIKKIIVYSQLIWLIGCGQTDCKDGINKIPMFGHIKKCQLQLRTDEEFLKECDKNFPSRQEAAKYYVSRGWDYFYKNEFDTAIMRFNQSWLLDSLNADIYWGYGNILGMRDGNFKESLNYLERSLKLNSNNARAWVSASTGYGQLFFETKDIGQLNKSIDCLKESLRLEPDNARVYAQLTAAYSYFIQKDSARKYLEITDRLDSNAVNPEVRKVLSRN